MPVQRSLFPDGFEVCAATLAALRDLDVACGRKLLAQARGGPEQLSVLQPGPTLLPHGAHLVLDEVARQLTRQLLIEQDARER